MGQRHTRQRDSQIRQRHTQQSTTKGLADKATTHTTKHNKGLADRAEDADQKNHLFMLVDALCVILRNSARNFILYEDFYSLSRKRCCVLSCVCRCLNQQEYVVASINKRLSLQTHINIKQKFVFYNSSQVRICRDDRFAPFLCYKYLRQWDGRNGVWW